MRPGFLLAWLVALVMLLLGCWIGSGFAEAATLTIAVDDAELERAVQLMCRWARCGPGTMTERIEKLRSRIVPEAALSVLLDDPAQDAWVDADGVRP